MQIFLIIALLVALLAVIFALQNAVPVSIAFLAWKTEGSLALVLLIALVVGALIAFIASLPAIIRGTWTVASQKKKLVELEAAMADCTRKLKETESRLQPATPVPGRPGEAAQATPPPA